MQRISTIDRRERDAAWRRRLLTTVLVFIGCFGWTTGFAQTNSGFTHDEDGNRTNATGQIRFTGVGGFSVEPGRAVPGDRINIYGRNFEVADPAQYDVSFGGEVGSVLAVSERVIAAQIPSSAAEGAIVVSLPDGTDVTVGELTLQGIVISPGFVDMEYGTSQQFTAQIFGFAGGTVTWEVESLVGADPGSITTNGLFMAPSAASGGFPILVKAISTDLGQTAFALVRGNCTSSPLIPFETLTSGNFAAGYERDCFTFSGTLGDVVSASYIGGPSARRFRILDEDGYVIAEANAGPSIATPFTILPQTGDFRVEVESDAGQTGDYQVWVAVHDDLSPGRWIHPGDGEWFDAAKWSGGAVPSASDDVIIPDYPGDLTITVASGMGSCASVVAEETVRFSNGGVLSVAGTFTPNGGIVMAGGTLADATIETGSGGEGVEATTSTSYLSGVTLAAPVLIESGESLWLSNGIELAGATITLGSAANGHCYLYLAGTQTISGTGEIVFLDSGPNYTRYLNPNGFNTTVTIGPDVTLRGANGQLSATTNQSYSILGTVRADVAGEGIAINRATNSGTFEATAGTIDANHMVGNLGNVIVNGGGHLDVDGTYTVDQPITVRDASTLTLRGDWINAASIAMTDSAIFFDGNFTQTGLGSFSRSGGTVTLLGECDLEGGAFTLDATTGDWVLSGGGFANGTLATSAGGTLVTSNQGGTFDAMTIAGDGFTVGSGHNVTALNDITIDTTITLGTLANGHTYFYANGTQTLDGTGQVVGAASAAGYTRYIQLQTAGSQCTIAPGFTITGQRVNLNAPHATSQFINEGTIRATGPGFSANRIANSGVLESDGGNFDVNNLTGGLGTAIATNGGVLDIDGDYVVDEPITVRANATMIFQGTWSNASSITMSGSTIELGGEFTLTGLGSFARTGGTVNLSGECDLEGGVLTLDSTTGDWTFDGGTLRDGTLATASGGTLITTNQGGTFDSVTFTGNGFNVGSSTNVTGINGLTFDAEVTIGSPTNGHAYFYANGVQTWGGAGTIRFEPSTGGWSRYVYLTGSGTELTLGPDLTVTGQRGSMTTTQATQQFINQGVIRAEADTVSVNRLTNQGSLESTGGELNVDNLTGTLGAVIVSGSGTIDLDGAYTVDQPVVVRDNSTIIFQGTWSNASSIAMTNSVIELGGNFTITGLGSFTRTGGTVNLSGVCDLEGGIFTLDASTGDWVFDGGTFTNGTLETQSGGTLLSSSQGGTFDAMTLGGDGMTVTSGTNVTATNGLTLDADVVIGDPANGHAYFYFNGTQTLGGTGEVVFEPSPGGWTRYMYLTGGGTILTLGPSVVVRGEDGNLTTTQPTQQFVNQGTITAEADTINVNRLSNQGVVQALGGTLDLNNVVGVLGSAVVNSGGHLNVDGVFTVDQPIVIRDASTLTLDGDWTNASIIDMTDSTVNLDGTFSIANVGTLTRSGGTVNLLGDLDLGGGTLAFDVTTGSWNVVNGSVTNGTVSGSGAGLVAGSSGTLDGITLQGDSLTIPGGGAITSIDGLDLDGATVTLGNLTNGNSTLYLNGTQSITGTGEIVSIDSPIGYTRYLWIQGTGSVVTLDPGVTVRGAHLNMTGTSTSQFVNDGTIRSEGTGESATVTRLSNNGLVEAVGGSTLTLNGTWSNSGTLSEVDSTLVMGGTFSWSGLGTVSRSGGSIRLTGTLDLEGSTLSLDAASGSWDLANGTISNGTISGSDGEGVRSDSGGTLDAITLQGTGLIIPASKWVTAQNGLVLDNATIDLGSETDIGTSYLYLNGTQSVTGTGEIVAHAHPSSYQRYLWIQGASSVVTVGNGITVRGADWTLTGTTNTQFDWQGVFRAEGSGETATLTRVQNAGTIEADTGTIVTMNGAWSNSGTFSVTDAELRLDGTFTNSDVGTITRVGTTTIDLGGDLDLEGGTRVFDAATGSWVVTNGGSVTNGTIDGQAGNGLTVANGGTLDGVTLQGSGLTIPAGGWITAVNGLTLDGATIEMGSTSVIGQSHLYVNGTQTISGTGEIVFHDHASNYQRYVYLQGTGSVGTIASGVTLRGADGNLFCPSASQSWVLNGTVRSEVSGNTITLDDVVNQGTLEALADANFTCNGTFSNAGTIALAAGSTFSRSGDYTQTAAGTLAIDVDGLLAGEWGQLTVTGAATFAGDLDVDFSFTPNIGNQFEVVTYASRTGTFSVNATGLGGGQSATVDYGASAATLEIE